MFELGAGWMRRMLGQILCTEKFRKGAFFPSFLGARRVLLPRNQLKSNSSPNLADLGSRSAARSRHPQNSRAEQRDERSPELIRRNKQIMGKTASIYI